MRALLLLSLAALAQGQTVKVDTFPMAAKATPDGKYLLVLNAGSNAPAISVIDIATAREISRAPVPDAWLGLTMSKTGDRVYVGGASKGAVFEYEFANGVLKPARMFPAGDFIGDVQFAPDGHLLYAAALFKDAVIVINPQSGLVLSRIKTGRRPYRILFHPSGKSFYVSSWSDGAIAQFNPDTGERISTVRVAPHTTDMVWSGEPVEDQPSVAGRLFVAAGNTNNVYVLGASEAGDLSRLESINLAVSPIEPLGVTPTGLGLSADGRRLFVACSGTDQAAVVDIAHARGVVEGFIAAGLYPTAVAALPEGRIAILNGHADSVQFAGVSDANPGIAPDFPEARPYPGTVTHVIYIMGDLKQGNYWATAAIAPDYTERLWPAYSAGRRTVNDFEGQEPANLPPAGYIWSAANQARLSMRSYGVFVDNRKEPEADGTQIANVRDPILANVTDPNYRGPDPAYPDSERAKEFLAELEDFAKAKRLPSLILVRMEDPAAMRTIANAVAKSPFGAETAVLILPSGASRERQLSTLRTVEIVLGLSPLTINDAAATPLQVVSN